MSLAELDEWMHPVAKEGHAMTATLGHDAPQLSGVPAGREDCLPGSGFSAPMAERYPIALDETPLALYTPELTAEGEVGQIAPRRRVRPSARSLAARLATFPSARRFRPGMAGLRAQSGGVDVLSDERSSHLRDLMKEATQCRTIAITSGKGGVGKSNVALNLAILLAAAGNRVALVDADLGMANLDVLLDLTVRGNLSHVIHGRKTIDEIIIDLPNGVQLVPGASGLARAAEMGDLQRCRLEREMTRLEEDNDIILVDTGAGLNNHVIKFAAAADNVMVVTTPEPTAMTDAYALTKVLHHAGYEGHLSMLVNMASGRHEARMTHQRIAGVARQFLNTTIFDAGYILEDARLRDAVRRREPVVLAYPRCPASKSLAALATKLCSGGALVARKEGFFRRVANWFS
jgi:flagellar biosynthesis protein FlhG